MIDLKSAATNNLTYAGVVTLSQRVKNKKIELARVHNSGANPLFSFFSNCLIGDFTTASTMLPNKIRLLQKIEDSGSTTYKPVSGFIFQTSRPERHPEESSGVVSYSFEVSRDMLEGTTFDCIGLYTSDTTLDETYADNFAAIAEVKEETKQIIPATSALIIDWKLIIANVSNT